MLLQIYSVFDVVSNQSVFITMHNNTLEAQRNFSSFSKNEQIAEKVKDLRLYHLGEFNTTTLELVGLDPLDVTPESEAL